MLNHVKRSEIVQSYFLSLFLWLVVGMIFAGIGVAFSVILHGFYNNHKDKK